ncbi:hypothetical protein ACWT_4507 [Actinoplanes sp. SE50]|uniref:hypothetical protein n=1 Tax=unclassified Actinoplanes TaxID=2626549 RepID=UPI00023ED0AC|nr:MULTISPECIES: hypothetical protein [unclassified Actinoplanes]AEV85529.1 hypothetical protein ACPL_4638 [Actinoplanes sp. SE50/110]ATO83922.1 hypothetical protein ACWT_4507 [Actinoplanes sp. SE50]SLM01332.1 hypothetical protein ACSP50_4568 [Actinoplanes sp. SE50/110]
MPIEQSATHPVEWWQQFQTATERFDEAILTTGLTELLLPKIVSQLLQREADIASDIAIAYRNRPGSEGLRDRYDKAAARLRETIERLADRDVDRATLLEAEAVSWVIGGDYARAAAEIEPRVGAVVLLRIFVSALRVAQLDVNVTANLLNAGRTPTEAIHAGRLLGRYGYWPEWLRDLVVEHALAGTLNDDFVAALDMCAFATLRSTQARFARSLLRGEPAAITTAARTLETIGETEIAARLRQGDMKAVAFAARFAAV